MVCHLHAMVQAQAEAIACWQGEAVRERQAAAQTQAAYDTAALEREYLWRLLSNATKEREDLQLQYLQLQTHHASLAVLSAAIAKASSSALRRVGAQCAAAHVALGVPVVGWHSAESMGELLGELDELRQWVPPH
eukprot:351545-Chlamydomonas_euryale.AAC.4